MFEGNNVRDENSDHALFHELGSSPASMEAAKLLDAFGVNPISEKLRQTPAKRIHRGAYLAESSPKQVAKGLGKEMLATNGTNVAGPIWTS